MKSIAGISYAERLAVVLMIYRAQTLRPEFHYGGKNLISGQLMFIASLRWERSILGASQDGVISLGRTGGSVSNFPTQLVEQSTKFAWKRRRGASRKLPNLDE